MELDRFDLGDSKKMFEELVDRALEGRHSDFEFIRSYEMLKVARLYRKGTKRVSKAFESLLDGLLREYASAIAEGDQRLEALMSAVQFGKCRDYYRKESEIADDMIKEYNAYVMSGHMLSAMLGGCRPDEECVDYRKLPWKLF